MKKYTCPYCKEEQKEIGVSETVSAIYKFTINGADWDRQDDIMSGEFEVFCLACGELSNELFEKFNIE